MTELRIWRQARDDESIVASMKKRITSRSPALALSWEALSWYNAKGDRNVCPWATSGSQYRDWLHPVDGLDLEEQRATDAAPSAGSVASGASNRGPKTPGSKKLLRLSGKGTGGDLVLGNTQDLGITNTSFTLEAWIRPTSSADASEAGVALLGLYTAPPPQPAPVVAPVVAKKQQQQAEKKAPKQPLKQKSKTDTGDSSTTQTKTKVLVDDSDIPRDRSSAMQWLLVLVTMLALCVVCALVVLLVGSPGCFCFDKTQWWNQDYLAS